MKTVNVIKRDGKTEKFSEEKLYKLLNWATNGNKYQIEFILQEFRKKIYDGISTQEIIEQLIKTVSNLISTLYPEFDEVAKRLFLLKIYKETWDLKISDKTGLYYPNYLEVIKKGLKYNVYDRKIIESFTEEELKELGEYIKPERDLLFSFKGLYLIMNKYALKYSKTKYLELPQHIYMRVAIQHFWNEKDRKKRLEKIKEKYDHMSQHLIIEASPKMINSLTQIQQLASCVLLTVEDDSWSILETGKLMGLYSKYSGGLGVDVSRIRASGSSIKGNRGTSNGVIPFIKLYEGIVSSFNQMGLRKGACCVYYPFWHYDVQDLVMLKDTGGSDELRARKLQYSVKWYNIFTKRIIENKDITLFDPKEVQELNETWGKDFEKFYLEYEEKRGIRKKHIKARELAYQVIKQRVETGNIYITFVDNINEQRLDSEPVFMSNLCTEVVIPSKPVVLKDKEKIVIENGDWRLEDRKNYNKNLSIEVKKYGEIGLCNLASINLGKWYFLNEKEKYQLVRNLMEGFDNAIETQFYPVKEAEISNKLRRPIGIGVYNYAYLLAKLGVDWTSDDAKEITHNVFEDILWWVLYVSTELAQERGPYYFFEESKWKEGLTPIDVSILQNRIGNKRPDLNRELKKDWDYIKERIRNYGVRFSYHLSIAPTATSSKITNGTEGIDPIENLFTVDEGTYTIPTIVPELKKLRQIYSRNIAWDIPTKTLIELGAIRQKFLDQSQSLTLYISNPKEITASKILEDILYAQMLGIKTLYYLKTKKSNINDTVICESCVL